MPFKFTVEVAREIVDGFSLDYQHHGYLSQQTRLMMGRWWVISASHKCDVIDKLGQRRRDAFGYVISRSELIYGRLMMHDWVDGMILPFGFPCRDHLRAKKVRRCLDQLARSEQDYIALSSTPSATTTASALMPAHG